MNTFKSLAACFAMTSFASVAIASSLVFSPAQLPAQVGEEVLVEVRGINFTDNVVGGGFDLNFNPAILSLSSVVIDIAEWELVSHPGTIDNQAGTLTAVWFNAFSNPLPSGNFAIATLRFTALAPGVSALNLLANPSFPFVSDEVEVIGVNFGSGAIGVVPEPSTWASLALGLALLPWLRLRLASA